MILKEYLFLLKFAHFLPGFKCRKFLIPLDLNPRLFILLLYYSFYYIIIIKNWQCKAGRERFPPYPSEDPSRTIPPQRRDRKAVDAK